MLKRIIWLSLITSLCLAGSALAGMRAGSFSFIPQVGYLWLDNDLQLDDAPLYGVGFGYNCTEHLGAEFFFGYAGADNQALGGDADIWLYRVDALYHFRPDQPLVPYLAVGVGGLSVDREHGKSDTDALFDWGGGVKYFFHQNLGLRFDLRHLINFGPPGNNFSATVGLEYLFGGARKVAMEPPAPAPEPVPVVVPAPKPLPKDSDGDGVIDSIDQCPDTAKGVAVDDRGCPIQLTLHIEFAFDRATVQPQYQPLIHQAAEFIRRYPQMKILIAGHTDSRGSEEYNLKLSQRRAEAVRRALITTEGIDPDTLVAVGYGESKPVASNDTEAGRQQNRRVEVICCTILPGR